MSYSALSPACLSSHPVSEGGNRLRAERLPETKGQRLFYGLFLPAGILANMVLGILILTGLSPTTWSAWLQIGTGALCCMIAGWLAASAWSRFYWSRSMSRQVNTWHRIADAFFAWVEEAPLPAESLHSLKTSLEQAVPGTETH